MPTNTPKHLIYDLGVASGVVLKHLIHKMEALGSGSPFYGRPRRMVATGEGLGG